MKKHIALIFILLSTILIAISCASENVGLKGKVYKDNIYKDKIFQLSEVDTIPKIIKAVRPFYPTSHGKFSRVEGKVFVRFIVDEKGFAKDLEVVESVPAGVFDKSALTAIKQIRFKPATKNGVPVDCLVGLPMTYNLNKFNHSKQSDIDARIYAFEYCYTRGFNYLKTGEYHKALESFNETINFNRQYSPCYYGRGIVFMNLGIYERAVSDFNKAIELAPGNGTYYKLRGQAYSRLKEYQKAIEDYSKAIEKKPDMIDAYFDRGEAFRELGKYKKAIDDYTRAIKLNKNYLQAYTDRADSYNKLNDTKDMCFDFKKACELGDCRGFNYAKKAGKCTGDSVTPGDYYARKPN